MPSNDHNYQVFERSGVVCDYASRQSLQPPEQTILEILGPSLHGASILDVGVGGGRTTPYLAPHAGKYVGVDVSSAMITACREKFQGLAPKISFEKMDVRNMESFSGGSFDYVFFTHNGLDCLNHEGRLQALHEIRRVLRAGGDFVFSSHNLRHARSLFSFVELSSSVRRVYRRAVENHHRRRWNPGYRNLLRSRYAIIRDGVFAFSYAQYYVDPEYAVEQLVNFGFSRIRLFSYITGKEIFDLADSQLRIDPWIYYMARLSGR